MGEGNKKIKGRKRPILVDTLGLIIGGVVIDAGTDDRWGLVDLLTEYFADGVKRLHKLWVDGAYPAQWLEQWGGAGSRPPKLTWNRRRTKKAKACK